MLSSSHEIQAHTRSVTSLKHSPNGKYLVSCGADKKATLYDSGSFETIQPLDIDHKGGINDSYWLDDGHLVTIADDGFIKVTDVEQNKICLSYRMNEAYPYCVTINPDNHVITVGDTEGSVFSYHIAMKDSIQKFLAHSSCVVSVQYSNDGEELISASHDGTVRQWIPLHNPLCTRTIIPCPKIFTPISSVCYSPNNQFLLTSTLDSTHRLFPRFHLGGDFTTPSCVKTYQGHLQEKFAVPCAFVPLPNRVDGILSGSENGKLWLWDIQNAATIQTVEAHKGVVSALTVRTSGTGHSTGTGREDDDNDDHVMQQVVSGGSDGMIKVWNYQHYPNPTTTITTTIDSNQMMDHEEDHSVPDVVPTILTTL